MLNIKKIVLFLLAAVLMAQTAGCGVPEKSSSTNAPETMPTDAAQNGSETLKKDEAPGTEYIRQGSFYDIAGESFAAGIYEISVTDRGMGEKSNALGDDAVKNDLLEMINRLYFHEAEQGETGGVEHLFKISIAGEDEKYYIDIYDNEDCWLFSLNDMWITRENDYEYGEIVDFLYNLRAKPGATEKVVLSDSEVISYFFDTIAASIDEEPLELKAGRYYLCPQMEKLEKWDPENPGIQSYFETDISHEKLNQLLNDIKFSYSDSPFVVAGDMEILNAEFNIQAIYEGHELKITASDSKLYIRTYINGDNYRVKVQDKDVYSTFIKMLDSNAKAFDFNDIADTEYITLHYVKDDDLKDFPENKRLSEKKITNNEAVNEIVDAIMQYSVPMPTYPSREDADLIFHTPEGDIYFKIKNPVTDDEDNLRLYKDEPTIIAEGCFWYDCPELYELLFENVS